MRHARSDYESIQDSSGKIPEDEPVFVIRAQDAIGPSVVREWARQARMAGVDPKMVQRVLDWAKEMSNYAAVHGSKIPDAPLDALKT